MFHNVSESFSINYLNNIEVSKNIPSKNSPATMTEEFLCLSHWVLDFLPTLLIGWQVVFSPIQRTAEGLCRHLVAYGKLDAVLLASLSKRPG